MAKKMSSPRGQTPAKITKGAQAAEGQCAAGTACMAPESADLAISTHRCWGCGLRVHSAILCGKNLEELILDNPHLVGRPLPSGRIIKVDAANERRCVCFTCIGKMVADENSNINNGVNPIERGELRDSESTAAQQTHKKSSLGAGGLINTDSEDSESPEEGTHFKSASEETTNTNQPTSAVPLSALPRSHIQLDGLRYSKADIQNVTGNILSVEDAWLDDVCMQIWMAVLQKKPNDSVELVFVTP
jgi:hypothetical protein